MEEHNRSLVAKALNVCEDDRSLPFFLARFDMHKMGRIQKAVASEDQGRQVLDVVAEDGTNYRIYVSAIGNPGSGKNMDTGKWIFRSVR